MPRLTLLQTEFSSPALYDRVCADVAAGRRVILLVPEQETLHTEAVLAERLPSSAPLIFEVSNFTRLANTVFRQVGGLSYRYADATTSALFMWQTLDALAPMLNAKGLRADVARIREFCAADKEMTAAGVSVEDLEATAKKLPADSRLRGRVSDLATVLSIFRAAQREHFGTVAEDLDALVEKLRAHRLFADTRFYIDRFSSFTAQEYKVIEALLATADLTVALALPVAGDPRTRLYAETEDTEARLRQIAAKAGVTVDAARVVGTPLPPPLAFAKRELFRADRRLIPYTGEVGEALRLISATDPFDACDLIAADIRRRVGEGARYRDFAIFVRRAEDYSGILDTALAAYDIPAFTSMHTDVRTLAPIKMIESLYAVLYRGFAREDLLSYLKCGFSGVSSEDADRFELYTEFWHVSGTAFTADTPFSMNPDGYTEHLSAAGEATLAAVNRAKDVLIPPIAALSKKLQGTPTVTEHVRALYDFLCEIGFEDELLRRAEAARAAGHKQDADSLSRLMRVLSDLFDRLHEIVGDLPLRTERFAALLSGMLGALALGHIPTSADEVVVGSAEMLRTVGVRYVYLLGVNDGEFPADLRVGGIFGDDERKILVEQGLSALDPQPEIRAARESFCFLRALCAATVGATLITTEKDAAGGACRPSAPFLRLAEMFKGAPVVKTASFSPLDRLYHPIPAAERLGEYLGTPMGDALLSLLSEDERFSALRRVTAGRLSDVDCRLSDEVAADLFPQRLNLTQSRIDAYADCPFAYFCRFALLLSDQKQAVFDAAGIGNLIHAVLEHLFLELKKQGQSIKELSREQLAPLVDRVVAHYVESICPAELATNARLEHLMARLRRTAGLLALELYEEFAQSGFDPDFFELPIGNDGPSPIVFESEEGTQMTIYGVIDRVDVFRREDGRVYLRVVDYKTGTKTFSQKDIPKGRNLQLLLYLVSLSRTENQSFLQELGLESNHLVNAAGMLYMSASPKDVALDAPASAEEIVAAARGNLKRRGLVLDDEDILRAMDADMTGKYLPFKPSTKSKSDARVTPERLGELTEEMERAVLRIGTGMCRGEANATPAPPSETHGRVPCDNCSFRPICRRRSIPQ